jgi:hypothetical protein
MGHESDEMGWHDGHARRIDGVSDYEGCRVKKGTADVRKETPEMIRAYRLCLQRYKRILLKRKTLYNHPYERVESRREVVR